MESSGEVGAQTIQQVRPWQSVVCVQADPYPPVGGVPLRNWQTIQALRSLGEVSLFSIFKGNPVPPPLPSDLPQSLGLCHWEHFDIGSPRRSPLEKLQRRLHWLRPDGYYYTDWLYTAEAARQLESLLRRVQPDLVVFEELWFYRYWPVVQRLGIPVVLDSHNVEALLAPTRMPQAKTWGDRLEGWLRPRQLGGIEGHLLRQVQQVWVCSELDAKLLGDRYGIPRPKVWVVPNGVNSRDYHPEQPSPRQPHTLLFCGSYSYPPNAIAAQCLIEAIFPALQAQIPTAQLWLVGQAPTPLMQQASQTNPAIQVTGRVTDVRPYLWQASLMAVPLTQGSGTRLKILEAMAAGCPVVSTAKGAEGLPAQAGVHWLQAETSAAMVAGILDLWGKPSQANAMAQAAQQWVQCQADWQQVRTTIAAAVQQMAAPPQA